VITCEEVRVEESYGLECSSDCMVRLEIRSQYFLQEVVGLSHLVGDEGGGDVGEEEGGGGIRF
jgi:hypothetical protein